MSDKTQFAPIGVFDSGHGGVIAVCEDYEHAYAVAQAFMEANYPCERLEECEEMWVAPIEPDEILC